MNVLMLLANPFVYDDRVYREAQSLMAEGHRVTLIGWDRTGEHLQCEDVDGIEVHRVCNPTLVRLLRRQHLQRFYFWWQAVQMASAISCDMVHCHDLSTLPAGLRLKEITGACLVYDAHDLYTYNLRRDAARVLEGTFRRIERRAAASVDALIVADDTYRDYFQCAGYREMVTVMNCKPLLYEGYQHPGNPVFELLYIGTLTRSRLLEEVVEVVGGMSGVRLTVAGLGPLAGRLERMSSCYENVFFLGRLPRQEVLPRTRSADAVVCLIDPADPNNRISSTNKQFEAMVAGRPVIASAGTRSGEITAAEDCGLIVDNTSDDLRRAVSQLRDDPSLCRRLGENGLHAAFGRYNWPRESDKLVQLYRELGDRQRHRRRSDGRRQRYG
jgi:glycosyltransferase involved in cell wall biosynthesis